MLASLWCVCVLSQVLSVLLLSQLLSIVPCSVCVRQFCVGWLDSDCQYFVGFGSSLGIGWDPSIFFPDFFG